MNLFGVIIDFNMNFPKRKRRVPKNVDETPINENITNKEYNSFDESEEEVKIDAPLSDIQNQALRFEEELRTLGIYDIPNATDLPPTYEIQDDVEIITSEFEKEQQDMIARMR